ncbi:MAG: hypothetical protein ACTSQF_00120 [Candidatus Heimdallarchaeaceae archaeon]
MSRNNDVSKVLFLPDEAAVAADAALSALANGNWGLYDYNTGLSVSALDADIASGLPREFFIAYVGDGTLGTAGEIYTTTGTHIRAGLIHYLTINNDAAPVAQAIAVQTFTGVQSGADATNYDYGVKFDFRGNTEIYQRYGYNQATKTFMGTTKCVGNTGAAEDAGAEICAQWAEAVGNDHDQFIGFVCDGTGMTGTGASYTPTGVAGTAGVWAIDGTPTTEALTLAEIRSYTTGSGDLIITFTLGAGDENGFSNMYTFCGVNAKYFKQRQIVAVPSLVGGECLWATAAETVAMIYGEGYGYDINELEYQCEGFTGKPGPYRQSRLNGLPFHNTEFIAIPTTKYTVEVLAYDQYSVGGWLEYFNNQSTYFILVATPTDTDAFPQRALAAIAAVVGCTVTTT